MITLAPKPTIAGKVVVITGASTGLGEATARAFAEAGAAVVMAAPRLERLQMLAAEIMAVGGQAQAVPLDLRQQEQITRFVQLTLDMFHRIDVLVNIVSCGRHDWFEELSAAQVRDLFELNVIGTAEITRQIVPTMKSQRSGYILNVNSYSGEIAVPPTTVYASTKQAVAGFSEGLRRELLPWGIEVIGFYAEGVKDPHEQDEVKSILGAATFASTPLDQVACQILELVEKPERSAHVGRLYTVPVLFDRIAPNLVDQVSALWVRWKRRRELEDETFSLGHSPAFQALAWVGGFLTAMAIIRAVIHIRFSRRGDT